MTYLDPFLALALALLLWALHRNRRRLAMAAVAGALLWAWPPVAWLLAGTLEWQLTNAPPFPPGDADAIVVLSGNALAPNPKGTQPSVAESTYVRCHYAAWLHRCWRPLPVLASGGHIRDGDQDLSLSEAMSAVLKAEGVPPTLVWTEDRSTSTYENALYSARILRAKGIRRIALVTEAYHMPRAVRCFRRQGLEVSPAPCEWRTVRLNATWHNIVPSPSTMLVNDNVLHEWLGMAWYKVSGKL